MRNRSLILAAFVTIVGAGAIAPADAQDESDGALGLPPETEPVPPYDYTFTSADRLEAAQACVHEATWAGANRTGDCGGILQVVMERRRPGERFRNALRRTMPRFYAAAGSRGWVRFLPSGPLRSDPAGWPYDYPARVHSEVWYQVNMRVSGYMRGVEPLPCSPTPGRWFGRRTDHEALERVLDRGHWCEATCAGEAETANAFLTRCALIDTAEPEPEPVPEEAPAS